MLCAHAHNWPLATCKWRSSTSQLHAQAAIMQMQGARNTGHVLLDFWCCRAYGSYQITWSMLKPVFNKFNRLWITQLPRSQDLAIFVLTMMTTTVESITLPLVHACRVVNINVLWLCVDLLARYSKSNQGHVSRSKITTFYQLRSRRMRRAQHLLGPAFYHMGKILFCDCNARVA